MRIRRNGLGELVNRVAARVRRVEVALWDGFNQVSAHVEDGKVNLHAHQHSLVGISVRRGKGGLEKESACAVRRIGYEAGVGSNKREPG